MGDEDRCRAPRGSLVPVSVPFVEEGWGWVEKVGLVREGKGTPLPPGVSVVGGTGADLNRHTVRPSPGRRTERSSRTRGRYGRRRETKEGKDGVGKGCTVETGSSRDSRGGATHRGYSEGTGPGVVVVRVKR